MTTPSEELFRPHAETYRRRLKKFLRVSIAGYFLVFLAILFPGPFARGMGIVGTVAIIFALLSFLTLPKLVCPACSGLPDRGFAGFCPACGGSDLVAHRMQGRRCVSCKRSMRSFKFRNYPIRFCTHCGTLLDRRGV